MTLPLPGWDIPAGYRIRQGPNRDDEEERRRSQRAQSAPASPYANDPLMRLREEAPDIETTSGWRSREYQADMRRRGYTPAEDSLHLDGDAVDLRSRTRPMSEVEAMARRIFGPEAYILNEGDHVHAQLRGWGNAPGTPGIPEGYRPREPNGQPPRQWDGPPEGFRLPQMPAPDPAFLANHGGGINPETTARMEGILNGRQSLPSWNPADTPEALIAHASRPRADAGAPGTAEVMPHDPNGTHIALTSDPIALRQALGTLEAAFDAGASREALIDIANQRGVIEASPGWLQQLDAALAWRAAGGDPRSTNTFVPGETQRVRPDAPVQQDLGEATVTGQRSTAELPLFVGTGAEASAYIPNWGDQIRAGTASALEPLMGRHSALEAGRNLEGLLGYGERANWLSPVPMAEWAQNYSNEAHAATMQGRPIEAGEKQLLATGSALLAIPIFGRARNASLLAANALTEIERVAVREGIDLSAQGIDDALAGAVRRNWQSFSPETREVVQPMLVGEAGPMPVGAALVNDLRNVAAAPPSLVQRVMARLRGRREQPQDAPPPGATLHPTAQTADDVDMVVGRGSAAPESVPASGRAADVAAQRPVTGAHGPIHWGLAGDYRAGLARLMADQTGEIPGAIRHPEIGPVDLIWGTENYGLAKIARRHPEVIDDLPGIVERLPVTQTPETTPNGRWVLEDANHRAVIAPDYDGIEQRWLITAFERKRPGGQDARLDPLSPGGVSPSAGASDIGPAAVPRNIRPEDVVPIPGSRPESMADFERVNPSTLQPVQVPRPETLAEMITLRHPIGGYEVRHRGPLDAEAFLRSRGGLRDDAGELRHIGITSNRARPEAPHDKRVGPILNPEGLTLDEAGEALWSAGYFRERPTTADVVDMLRQSRIGHRLWHPDDLGTIENIENAQAMRFAADEAAQEGRPLAQQVGEPIGPDDLDALQPPVSAYEDAPQLVGRVGNLNLNRLKSPGDITRLVRQVEDQVWLNPEVRRRVANEETRRLAQELDLRGKELAEWSRLAEEMPQRVYAARVFVDNSRRQIVRTAGRMRGASDEDLARFHQMVAKYVEAEQHLTRMAAGSGRATQQFRMVALPEDASSQAVASYLRSFGGRETVEDVAAKIVDLVEDPASLGRFIRAVPRVRKRDMINELWINSLLSGPRTHVVNAVSNMFTAAYQVPEQAAAAAIGAVLRSPDRVTMREVGARAIGLIQGAREGLPLMRRAFRTGEPVDDVMRVEARNHYAVPGRLGHVIRTPTRALTAADEFFKAMNRRASINAQAYRRAASEGGTREEVLARYDDLRRNPDDAMTRAADREARYYTFQTELGKGGRAVQQFANEVPGAKFVIPFVRTPINLLKFAAERNVVTAPLFREYREALLGKMGARARNEAWARVTMGTGLSAWAVTEALEGRISGGGPSDPRERAALLNAGWQPYSFKLGDSWISYQRFEPLSLLIGAAADFAELGAYASPEEADQFAMNLGIGVAKNVTSKTWLSGLSDFFDMLSDPERYGPGFVQRLASSAAVPAIASHAAQAVDPNLREARTILEGVRARIPVVSRGLNERLNVWGDPLKRGASDGTVTPGSAVVDFISPVYQSRESNSPLMREVARLRAPISMPQRSITINRKSIRLTPEQYSVYVQLSGRPARAYLEGYIQQPDYRARTDQERRDYIRSTMEHFRDAARDTLKEMYPELMMDLPEGYSVRRAAQ